MADNLDTLFDIDPDTQETAEETSTPTPEEEVENPEKTPEESEETGDETHEEEGEEIVEETGEEDPTPKDDSPKDETSNASEVVQLRAMLRDQNRRLRELQAQIDKSQKELTEKGVIDEPEEEESEVEARAEALRASILETLLETMRLNPKYEDVDTVVTQSRFDDMVEAYSYSLAKKEGGSAEDYVDAVAAKIWGMSNPYRFMYDNIKQHHPDFAKPATPEKEPDSAPEKKPAEKREPKPKTSPTSISSLPASSEGGGWTAARIDGMAEEELGKVPRDIYQKYLSGELK
jgi:hypothetical protein